MANTPPRAHDDPYDGLLMWVVIASGLLLAASIWAWPHIPEGGLRYLFFFGTFIAFYTVASVFAALSRAGDARARRR